MPLGKPAVYSGKYNPEHLFPIPREEARKEIGIKAPLPFEGADIWNAWEISWLDPGGKPQIAIGKFIFPAYTENILESKSVKLYLNSFNQTVFDSAAEVMIAMEKDFTAAAKGKVSVSLATPDRFSEIRLHVPEGLCLDDLDIGTDRYEPDPDLLTLGNRTVRETLHSNLFKANCPVTGQPDWATIIIDYAGRQIDHKGLLRYFVSFREHAGFHENCVERIFADISAGCSPERLTVHAGFARRGGISINPFRSDSELRPYDCHFIRQ